MTDLPIARFPDQDALRNQLVELVRYSTRASARPEEPPVRFRVNDRSIDVCLPADCRRRTDLYAAGAAIADLELAMRCFLLDTQIEHSPDPALPNWIARVWVLGATIPVGRDAEAIADGFDAVKPTGGCHPTPVAREIVRELLAEAAAQGALLFEVDLGPPRECLRALLAEGESRHGKDLPLARRWARGFDRQRGRVPNPATVPSAPAVFLLATRDGEPAGHLAAGQASRRIERRLAAHGLSVREYSDALAYADLREALAMQLNPEIHVHTAFYIGRA
ncbi:MAG: hypothetical protein ACO1SV_06405 [Fimbriimonas sp.]